MVEELRQLTPLTLPRSSREAAPLTLPCSSRAVIPLTLPRSSREVTPLTLPRSSRAATPLTLPRSGFLAVVGECQELAEVGRLNVATQHIVPASVPTTLDHL